MFQICSDSIHSTPAPYRKAIALNYKDSMRMARAHGYAASREAAMRRSREAHRGKIKAPIEIAK
jgi:hypothetical protein